MSDQSYSYKVNLSQIIKLIMDIIVCRYFKSQWGFPLRKDLEFNDLIDLTILKMKDAGIHDSIMRRYGVGKGEAGHCLKRAKGSSLNIFTTVFSFFVLLVGIVLSILMLVMEVVWSRWKHGKGNTNKWAVKGEEGRA